MFEMRIKIVCQYVCWIFCLFSLLLLGFQRKMNVCSQWSPLNESRRESLNTNIMFRLRQLPAYWCFAPFAAGHLLIQSIQISSENAKFSFAKWMCRVLFKATIFRRTDVFQGLQIEFWECRVKSSLGFSVIITANRNPLWSDSKITIFHVVEFIMLMRVTNSLYTNKWLAVRIKIQTQRQRAHLLWKWCEIARILTFNR